MNSQCCELVCRCSCTAKAYVSVCSHLAPQVIVDVVATMLFGVLIFVAATLAKAWEPLAVSLIGYSSEHDPKVPFAGVLLLCEAAKLSVLLPATCLQRSTSMLSWHAAAVLGVPAALLAVCNLCLGYAVPRLSPMLYQALFKAISVIVTAALSRLLLGQAIGRMRAVALVVLLASAHICAESAREHQHQQQQERMATDAFADAWRSGLLAVLCGAVALALSSVWFELVTIERSSSSISADAAVMAVWGIVLYAALLGFTESRWLRRGRLLRDARRADVLIAALSIAAADLTMLQFLATHSSNAYSFSRVLALVLSSAIAVLAIGETLEPAFVVGAAGVCASGWVYREHEPAGRHLHACCQTRMCSPRDRRRGGGYRPVAVAAAACDRDDAPPRA